MFLKELEAERQLKMEEVSRSIHPPFSPLVCDSVLKCPLLVLCSLSLHLSHHQTNTNTAGKTGGEHMMTKFHQHPRRTQSTNMTSLLLCQLLFPSPSTHASIVY